MASTRRKQPSEPKDELDLERVMPHHRAAWRVERIAWTIGALALIAAMLGLFGYGPMSRTTVGSPGALQIEYDRFQRSSSPNDFALTVNTALARNGELRVRFDQSLVDHVEFDDIVPDPEKVFAGTGHTEFVFNITPGEHAPAHIAFRFRPTTFGHRVGQVTVNGAPPLTLDQYVYP